MSPADESGNATHGTNAKESELVVELSDVLDLHTFLPREIKPLIADYLDVAVEREWPRVQLIHGRGAGVQRRIVHSILERHPSVVAFQLSPGNPGATEVELIRPSSGPTRQVKAQPTS